MKVIGINGSPRKNKNTATMLDHALKGAASKGAETEIVHLYDYNFQGCISCFACKLKNGSNVGICAVKDDVSDLLHRMNKADTVIFASPIYFADVTASTRALMERFMYAPFRYSVGYGTKYTGKMKSLFIYTMNAKAEMMAERGYFQTFETNKAYLTKIYGASEYITTSDTTQFSDYSKYDAEAFDPAAKAKVKEEVFPLDCEKAFNAGASLVG